MKADLKKVVVSIAICQLAGVFGSLFTYPEISTWYASLDKPSFTPPNWVFGPAWFLLFTLMGISLYLVWQKGIKGRKEKRALYAFSAQFVLNALWSLLFFGLHSPLYGLVGIILMWVSILVTIIMFYGIGRRAAYLLVPYIAWVSFAATLNFAIWILNS